MRGDDEDSDDVCGDEDEDEEAILMRDNRAYRDAWFAAHPQALLNLIEQDRATVLPPDLNRVPMANDYTWYPRPWELYLLDHPEIAEQLGYSLDSLRLVMEEKEGSEQ